MVDVSIIVPVYNVEKYVRPSIEAMLAQTDKNIEIILVDDASPDGSGKICDEFAARDSRVRVIHKEKNEGTGMARQTGMDAATGEYLYFADPDDITLPRLVEDNIRLAREADADIVVFGFTEKHMSADGSCLEAIEYSPEERVLERDDFWKVFNGDSLVNFCLWCRLYRRSFITENNLRHTSLSTGQDAYFIVDTLSVPFNKIAFNPQKYYEYLKRPNSAITTFKPERFENQYKLARHFDAVAASLPHYSKLEAAVDKMYLSGLSMAIENLARTGSLSFGEKTKILGEAAERAEIKRALRRADLTEIHIKRSRMRLILLRHFGVAATTLFNEIILKYKRLRRESH